MNETNNTPQMTADLIKQQGTELAHWRGFTKYAVPNWGTYAVSSNDIVLGPCEDGQAADGLIAGFYRAIRYLTR